MEARLVPLAKHTPSTLRNLGVCEVGRVGSILYVHTAGPLVLIHVTAMQDRQLDRFGLDRARLMIDELGHAIDAAALYLGINSRVLVAQLTRDGWVQSSRQLDAPRKGANARVGRPSTGGRKRKSLHIEVPR